eukprot:GILK01006963.1.p1 GENE.GILK01006963.1~~GILK01006963.1.p1  ORF type:complete len:112 (-),score=12.38 GILK01006963.1:129-428(-)
MSTNVAIIAQLRIKPEKAEDFCRIMKELIPASRAEPGCLRYDVIQSMEHTTLYFVNELWLDDNAVQAHFSSEAFSRLVPQLGEVVAEPAVINQCRIIDL